MIIPINSLERYAIITDNTPLSLCIANAIDYIEESKVYIINVEQMNPKDFKKAWSRLDAEALASDMSPLQVWFDNKCKYTHSNKHILNCCLICGCKFDDENCPVYNGIVPQSKHCCFDTYDDYKKIRYATEEIKRW